MAAAPLRCYACGNVPARPARCAACKTAVYCDKKCQAHAWLHHDHAAWCAHYARAAAIGNKRGREGEPGDPNPQPARRARTGPAPPPPRAPPPPDDLQESGEAEGYASTLPEEMIRTIVASETHDRLMQLGEVNAQWARAAGKELLIRGIYEPAIRYSKETGRESLLRTIVREDLKDDAVKPDSLRQYKNTLRLLALYSAIITVQTLTRLPFVNNDALIDTEMSFEKAFLQAEVLVPVPRDAPTVATTFKPAVRLVSEPSPWNDAEQRSSSSIRHVESTKLLDIYRYMRLDKNDVFVLADKLDEYYYRRTSFFKKTPSPPPVPPQTLQDILERRNLILRDTRPRPANWDPNYDYIVARLYRMFRILLWKDGPDAYRIRFSRKFYQPDPLFGDLFKPAFYKGASLGTVDTYAADYEQPTLRKLLLHLRAPAWRVLYATGNTQPSQAAARLLPFDDDASPPPPDYIIQIELRMGDGDLLMHFMTAARSLARPEFEDADEVDDSAQTPQRVTLLSYEPVRRRRNTFVNGGWVYEDTDAQMEDRLSISLDED